MYEPTLEDHAANLKHPDPDVRRNAAWLLGRMRDERIISPLIAALKDDDTAVRVRAAEALGNYKDERPVQPLIDLLAHETDAEVRTQAVASLGRQGDTRAYEAVANNFRDESTQIRVATAEALANIPHASAIMALTAALTGDSDSDVRYQASRSLIHIGSESVVNALLTMTEGRDSDATLRVLEILGQLRDSRAAEYISQFVDDEDAAIAETAKWALKRTGR